MEDNELKLTVTLTFTEGDKITKGHTAEIIDNVMTALRNQIGGGNSTTVLNYTGSSNIANITQSSSSGVNNTLNMKVTGSGNTTAVTQTGH